MNRRNKLGTSRGFTLTELLLGVAAGVVVMAGVYTLSRCATILTYKNISINITGTAARNALDRMQLLLQTAYVVPTPIDSVNGTALSGSLSITGAAAVASGLAPVVSGSSGLTITGTGPGIAFDRVVGSPYLLTVPTGGIPSTTGSLTITMDTAAQVPPPPPKGNDLILIYTTAILTGTDNQVRARVANEANPILTSSTNGTRITYTVHVIPPLVTSGTLPANISYSTVSSGTGGAIPVTTSAMLLRSTAFVVTNQLTAPTLRYYDSYLSGTSGNMVDLVNSKYVNFTDQIDTPDAIPSQFSVITFQSKPFVGVVLHVRAKNYDNFLKNNQADSYSTFMGLGSMISLKSVP